MNKPYPALCKDCKWSRVSESSRWETRCQHPRVNAQDAWALTATTISGSAARDQRERKWFAVCGQSGKLWEPRTGPDRSVVPVAWCNGIGEGNEVLWTKQNEDHGWIPLYAAPPKE